MVVLLEIKAKQLQAPQEKTDKVVAKATRKAGAATEKVARGVQQTVQTGDTQVLVDTIEEGGRDYVDISEDIVVEGTDVAADMGEQVTDIVGEIVTATTAVPVMQSVVKLAQQLKTLVQKQALQLKKAEKSQVVPQEKQ